MIPIDKGVPIPAYVPGPPVGSAPKYPWRTMEVGDSFFVGHMDSQQVSSGAAAAGRKLSRRFVTRRLIEDGIAGIRVWRTA